MEPPVLEYASTTRERIAPGSHDHLPAATVVLSVALLAIPVLGLVGLFLGPTLLRRRGVTLGHVSCAAVAIICGLFNVGLSVLLVATLD